MSAIKLLMIAAMTAAISLGASNALSRTNRAIQNDQDSPTCEEAAAEVAKFKNVFTEWGNTFQGAVSTSSRHSSEDGEWFGYGITIFKSKSRFDKSVRLLTEKVEHPVSRSPISDKGRRVGERVVNEEWRAGKLSRVHIWRIKDRMVQGIDAFIENRCCCRKSDDFLSGGGEETHSTVMTDF